MRRKGTVHVETSTRETHTHTNRNQHPHLQKSTPTSRHTNTDTKRTSEHTRKHTRQFDFGQLAEVDLAELELAEVERPRPCSHPPREAFSVARFAQLLEDILALGATVGFSLPTSWVMASRIRWSLAAQVASIDPGAAGPTLLKTCAEVQPFGKAWTPNFRAARRSWWLVAMTLMSGGREKDHPGLEPVQQIAVFSGSEDHDKTAVLSPGGEDGGKTASTRGLVTATHADPTECRKNHHTTTNLSQMLRNTQTDKTGVPNAVYNRIHVSSHVSNCARPCPRPFLSVRLRSVSGRVRV